MTQDQNERPLARRGTRARPYLLAMGWVTIVWLTAVAALVGLALLGLPTSQDVSVREGLIIAVASLFIAHASMLPSLFGHLSASPGAVREKNEDGRRLSEKQLRQTGLLVAGVMIRLTGTVALFLTCRYQMATPTETVAAMTIGWYVLLTFVDVLVLARELPNFEPPDLVAGASESALSRSPANDQGLVRD